MKVSRSADERMFQTGRRSFLRIALLGGGSTLLALSFPKQESGAAETEVLLLSCMDFRLVDETARYMVGRGLRDKYDHVILAGASLGALTDKYPAWNKTFWEHLDIAIQLHKIKKVIVLDHRDCGAYRVILGEDFAKDPAKETEIHATKTAGAAQACFGEAPETGDGTVADGSQGQGAKDRLA